MLRPSSILQILSVYPSFLLPVPFIMEEDEDDDIYAPSDAIEVVEQNVPTAVRPEKKGNDLDDGEEEGEEIEEDSSDSVLSAV